MKINRFGKAEVLTPDQINLLFTEGFVKPRDKALFGVCLYAACRINEACTLFTRDVFGSNGIRPIFLLRSFNTKGKRDTREIQIHPTLRRYLEEYDPNLRKDYLFPGRHGLGHIHKASADKILRAAFYKVGIEGAFPHSFRRTADSRHPEQRFSAITNLQVVSGQTSKMGQFLLTPH